MHRSWVPKEWVDNFIYNSSATLPKEVYQRFFSIVRIKPSEIVSVFDGHGREITGELIEDKISGSCHFSKASLTVSDKPMPPLILMQAALQEAKLEDTIQRGTEIGVDEFIIFNAERSEPFCYAKFVKKQGRFMRIAQDACRQSGRTFMPSIVQADSLSQALKQSLGWFGVFGSLADNTLLSTTMQKAAAQSVPIAVLVGPEGGLSTAEHELARTHNFQGVRWAPYTLRSELAGVFAMAIVQASLGRG